MSLDKRVEFTAIRTDWTILRLENGTILKLTSPLANLIPAEGQTRMEFRPPSYVDPVDDDKGSPSEDERIQEGDVIGEVKFVIIKETTDIYETQGRTIILIGHEIRKVRRTKKFDRNGTRIYEAETALRGAVLPYAMKEEAGPAPTTSVPST